MSEIKKELWNSIRNRSKNVENEMDPLLRKRTGSYFTGLELTDSMMCELIDEILKTRNDLYNMSFLEPCVGAGNFVFSYLKQIDKLEYSNEQLNTLLDNIYVVDINETALSEYERMLTEFAAVYWGINLQPSYFEKHLGKGLLIDVSSDEPRHIELKEVFGEDIANVGFDIVVTNPPYKNLKAERGQYSNDEDYDADKGKYAAISKLVKKHFSYSTDGVLNLYKIFVEEIIDSYANENAYISLLIPATIMSDKTSEKLRTHILLDSNLISIKVIGEGSKYIDAQQALSSVLIQKGTITENIRVTKDFSDLQDTYTLINIEDIKNVNTGNSIFAIDEHEYSLLKQLRKFPVVKDLDFIINLRGELDLTANKNCIVNNDTGYPLLRGRNIAYYDLVDADTGEFISQEFVETTKKVDYIKHDRIICQQVVNMHKERRVTYAYIGPNYVLGNSCNFLTVENNLFGIDTFAILGLFNSSVVNWLFKLTSSNNHVNNYEIDCFPVPVDSPILKELSIVVQEYLQTKDEKLLEKIEMYALKAYGIE